MNWKQTCQQLTTERGGLCEYCGRRAVDAHHAVIKRIASKRKWLDVPHNAVLLCRSCHNHAEAHARASRRLFWGMLCDRYGRDVMLDWLEALPLKVKPRVEELEG